MVRIHHFFFCNLMEKGNQMCSFDDQILPLLHGSFHHRTNSQRNLVCLQTISRNKLLGGLKFHRKSFPGFRSRMKKSRQEVIGKRQPHDFSDGIRTNHLIDAETCRQRSGKHRFTGTWCTPNVNNHRPLQLV